MPDRRWTRRSLLLTSMVPALAQAAPAGLTRGVNITGWFRFPVSRNPRALADYMSDRALRDLHDVGFDFVRLAIDPDIADPHVLIPAIRRIQGSGLSVIVSPHPRDWHLEKDISPLRAFWRKLAPALRALDLQRTFPEIVNEPVFPHDPGAWANLQQRVLADIRTSLPDATVVLTGNDWGSIDGLLKLPLEADANVIYSFHFYDPAELTSLAAYRANLDRSALAELPFPAGASCEPPQTDAATADLFRYYCSLHWDTHAVTARIDRAAAWAKRNKVRLLAGEFGASAALNAPARLAWLRTVREACQARDIAWALWGYDDVMGFAVSRPPPNRPALDRGVLSALGLATKV